jgi:hypothetical protein
MRFENGERFMAKLSFESSLEERIRNRESWLKIFIVLFIIGIIFWKIADGSIKFEFTDFVFSDLLAILLAFFAIGLSIVFYFKATDTSNKFYDNTYNFTKDISETLGRIEERFGEKLGHIEHRVDNIPYGTKEETKKEIDDEQKKLIAIQKERDKLLEELAKKAKLETEEKNNFLKEISEKDFKIANLRSELDNLKHDLGHIESKERRSESGDKDDFLRLLKNYTRRKIIYKIGIDTIMNAPREILTEKFRDRIKTGPSEYIRDLMHFEIIDRKMNLTDRGIDFLREIVKESIE